MGVTLGVAAAAVATITWLIGQGSERPLDSRQRLRRALTPATRVVSGNLVQFISYRLDIFLLAAWASSRETGIYALAVALGSVLWYLADAVGQVTYPRACSTLAEGQFPRIAIRATVAVISLTTVAGLVLAAASAYFVPKVFGVEFSGTVQALWLLLPGICLFTVPKIFGGVLVAAGREWSTSGTYGVAAVVTIVLDVLLIPRFGANGAAIASSVAYGVASVITIVLARRLFLDLETDG